MLLFLLGLIVHLQMDLAGGLRLEGIGPHDLGHIKADGILQRLVDRLQGAHRIACHIRCASALAALPGAAADDGDVADLAHGFRHRRGDLRQLLNDHLELTGIVHLGQRFRLFLQGFCLRQAHLTDRLRLGLALLGGDLRLGQTFLFDALGLGHGVQLLGLGVSLGLQDSGHLLGLSGQTGPLLLCL